MTIIANRKDEKKNKRTWKRGKMSLNRKDDRINRK